MNALAPAAISSLARRPPFPLDPASSVADSYGIDERQTLPLQIAATQTKPLSYGEMTSTAAGSRTLGMGRFVSTDPVAGIASHAGSWNAYTFALNNPLKYVDPDGLDVTLFVRNSGPGATNFGHTALRVFGRGYDFTYDFGRYRGGTGLFKMKGPGILRVWTSWPAFLKSQAGKGDSLQQTWDTSAAFDRAVMDYFDAASKAGEQIDAQKFFTAFQLKSDYNLLSNNCTTICLGALASAESRTGEHPNGLGNYKGENDPRDLFDQLEQEIKDRIERDRAKKQKDMVDN